MPLSVRIGRFRDRGRPLFGNKHRFAPLPVQSFFGMGPFRPKSQVTFEKEEAPKIIVQQ